MQSTELSHNLKLLRTSQEYNLSELAAILGVSKSAISDYENNKSSPSAVTLFHYCKTFNVSMSNIMKIRFKKEEYLKGKYKDDMGSKSNSDLKLKNTYLKQRSESLELHIKILNNLIESKTSEINALRIQIQLLEKNINYF